MIAPRSSTSLAVVASALSLLACHRDVKPPAAAPVVKVNEVAASLAAGGLTLDADDPATCAPCHDAIVTEWKESLHSRAHHASDPLYGALRALRVEKQGPHIPGKCASCHNPRDAKDHDSKAARTGVSCAVCHQLDGVHAATKEKKGVDALVVGPEKTFRGPHDVPNGTAPLHATGAALPALADGQTLCLACHAEEQNAAGVPTCTTGLEHAEAGSGQSCASCHMAEVATPAGAVSTRPTHKSHRFAGPHQAQRLGEPGVLADAVAVTGRFEGGQLVARLENKSSHAFPTGFPGRMAMLVVSAFDAQGQEVFKNIKSEPMKEHPEAVLNKGYVDAEGKPTLAAFGVKLVRDNRLQAGETRELRLALPASAVRAELRLRYFLLAPPAAKLMGYDGPETKPVTLAPVVVAR